MKTQDVVNTKIDRMARTFHAIVADTKGNLPTRIEVLKVGMWDTTNHGMFMISPQDIDQMIQNFNDGIGLPGQGTIGAPIDFGHDSDEEAAGWMVALSTDGNTLYADVEWTASGTIALEGKNYKCFSPEFYPACRGGWEDSEQYGVIIPNVLVGGGLTNIPLFKGLKPITASNKNGDKIRNNDNVIYISASVKENKSMTLEEVKVKELSQLTDEEKAFITEQKANLSTEELTKFGLGTAPVAPVVVVEDTPVVDPELAVITASLKSGESVVIKASQLKALEDTAQDYRKEKASQVVMAHVNRGAIKADSIDAWTSQVMADQKNTEELLKSIPDNKLLADDIGTEHGNEEVDERQKIVNLASAKVVASDGKMTIQDAMKLAAKEVNKIN